MALITSNAATPPASDWWAEDLIRVFESDPDLVQDLDRQSADHLRRRVVARAFQLEPGTWSPRDWLGGVAPSGWLGLLVIDGLLTRSLSIDGRDCPELVGAGDLLRPWQGDDTGARVRWKVLATTTLALLDDRFAAIAGRWPSIFGRLLERSMMRTQGISFQLALANVRRADARLEMLMWHLAERWGRVTPDGVVVPLPLTHDLIGHLACMRRPTATSALHRLMRSGRLDRRLDGSWILPSHGPSARPSWRPAHAQASTPPPRRAAAEP
jgi:CRP/FNR family transcriptional regulator, cyclic AMP receptor protein